MGRAIASQPPSEAKLGPSREYSTWEVHMDEPYPWTSVDSAVQAELPAQPFYRPNRRSIKYII